MGRPKLKIIATNKPKIDRARRYFIYNIPHRFIPGGPGENIEYPIHRERDEKTLGFFENEKEAREYLRKDILKVKRLPRGTILEERDVEGMLENLQHDNETMKETESERDDLIKQVEAALENLSMANGQDIENLIVELQRHEYMSAQQAIGKAIAALRNISY